MHFASSRALRVVAMLLLVTLSHSVPSFDPTAILRNVLIPADAQVNSIIYRLRASDPEFDYPLEFAIAGDSTSIVGVDSLNCSRLNSVCQANVILRRRLEAGRFYDFRVSVTGAKRRQRAFMDCSLRATNATTPIGDIFPGAPTLLMVSEAARRNTELGSLIARGNPLREKAVVLELWGSPQFGLRQRIAGQRDAEGTIILLRGLDYETRTVHHLTILANDPWTEPEKDTRNIAAWPLLVAVLDEQDTPPVFTLAPPTTTLAPDLQPGDVILRVQAEDGDRGKPRDIRYGLVPEGNPFVQFFNLSEDTGELRLMKPLIDIQSISHSNIPIILTVVAEEVRSNAKEAPSQSATVKLALIPPALTSPAPYFNKQLFDATLEENAPVGTQLDLDLELIGATGTIYTLQLDNNNGTFDVIPNVIEGRSKFVLKVHDNQRLDYEKSGMLMATLIARELGDGNATASALLRVTVKDMNDNAPEFMQRAYAADVLENAEVGATVLKVLATDRDRRTQNIRYALEGAKDRFAIDAETGVIRMQTANLNAEDAGEIAFKVIARDIGRGGTKGPASTVDVVIKVLDVNDQEPVFDKSLYEFIVEQSRRRFTVPAFLVATDRDVAAPNNEVRYELIGSVANLTVDEITGELSVVGQWNYNEIVTLQARAYDNGVPRLWSECELRLYPPENAKSYKMLFVVSGTNPNRRELEASLSKLIGGKVVVDRLRPYTGDEPHVLDVSDVRGGERSVAETTVTFESANSVLDIERIKEILYKKEEEQSRLKAAAAAGGSWDNWWWLLLIILLLILLFCLIMVLCCVLEGCPLYVTPRKRRRRVTPVDIEKVVLVKDEGGVAGVVAGPPVSAQPPPQPPMENRSVQVAEWFGRREAWTPEHDEDMDSIRRHEMERGSERGRKREYYIREGGADILRLVTRGPATEPRPVTLLPEQTYVIDGKDILMRRYIDQQQQVQQAQLQQTTLNRIQSEHELLEESLRQQNALLRQILLERERDLRLETQSLPAGTQTDQNASTQTEFVYLRPPVRQTRSDNDASTDDEEYTRRYERKRRSVNKTMKRKIRTPIQEESEQEGVIEQSRKPASGPKYTQTRASILRQMKGMKTEVVRNTRSTSSRSLRKEVLQEISDSLNQSDSDEGGDKDMRRRADQRRHRRRREHLSDSLEDSTTPPNDHPPSQLPLRSSRRKSENDIRDISQPQRADLQRDKSFSQHDLTRLSLSRASNSSQRSRIPLRKKSSARYMEWYKPNTSRSSGSLPAAATNKSKLPKPIVSKKEEFKTTATKVSKKTVSAAGATGGGGGGGGGGGAGGMQLKNFELPTAPGPEHPLIQHSKNRFESAVAMPASVKGASDERKAGKENKSNAGSGLDADVDSGIALTTRPAMAQKKSVFTIAYDDMATRQLPESISTTP